MSKIVCSTTHVFHYMFNQQADTVESMLKHGIRPLSDFPESERWQEIQHHMPNFFEKLYEMIAEPIIQKPYGDSGIFVTPIDFYELPNTYLHDKERIAIPIERIDSKWAAATYIVDEERQTFALNQQVLQDIAELWREDWVREWFGKDQTKVFFYVPQIVTYQANGIPITEADFQRPANRLGQ
jgi:hypothetical protein